MNRRGFLGSLFGLAGAVALGEAERVGRVYSFPSRPTIWTPVRDERSAHGYFWDPNEPGQLRSAREGDTIKVGDVTYVWTTKRASPIDDGRIIYPPIWRPA